MKQSIVLAAMLGLAMATGTLAVAATTKITSAQSEIAGPEVKTVTLAVEKMTCALCPATVKAAIERVDGVRSVSVDFNHKTATVGYDPSVTNVDEIAAASTNAGYPARAAG